MQHYKNTLRIRDKAIHMAQLKTEYLSGQNMCKKYYHGIYFIFGIFIMLFIFAVSPISANAWTATTGYTGKEDPEDATDFSNTMKAMNKYKAWCVFKGLGMTDEQAIAALACMEAEGSYRSEVIEGKDPLSLNVTLGTTKKESDKYIDTYSALMDTDADFRTDCTDAIVKAYGVSQSDIDKAHTGNASSAYASKIGKNLSLSTYYDNAGVGWVGCGLYQFTGSALKKLFVWSDNNSSRWFEFENQLAYYITDSADGYKGSDILQRWIEDTKDKPLDECVETYFHTMINGNALPDFVANRQAIANALYPEMYGLEWNKKYAQKVLSMAGLGIIDVRTGIIDKSLYYEHITSVLKYPRNAGYLCSQFNNDELDERNKQILNEYFNKVNGITVASTPTYSLFELFGEDLHWYKYFGEETYTITLADHIWSAIDQNKTKDLLNFDTINYDAYSYLSCNVYPDRVTVLTKEDLKNGQRDPRVEAVQSNTANIMDNFTYTSGEFKLYIAKSVVAIISFLIGPELKEYVVDVLNFITGTEVWPVLKNVFIIFLGISMIFFVLSIVGKAIKYAKGQGAARDLISRALIGTFCLILFYSSISNPTLFNSILSSTLGIIDSTFNKALTATISNDEVIAVNDDTLAIHATLWKKAVFNPWCRGVFDGEDYENLYTQFATVDDSKKMPQDFEVVDVNDTTGKAFYDSATATGDVFVPVGGGKEIRNWAAYLYSCGTKYHIDSTIDETTFENIDGLEDSLASGTKLSDLVDMTFPNWTTKTTANNPILLADTFRVIDAQMNISPQYFANGTVSYNYQNAHKLNHHYIAQGNIALFNTLLLVLFVPMIFVKLKSLILMMITMIKMIFYTIMELFKENTGLKALLDSIKKHFKDYTVSSLKLNLLITLYYLFVDQGLMGIFLYIILGFIILGFSFQDGKRIISDTKYYAQKLVRKI